MLSDEQIDQAFEGMADGPSGFLKSWGYRQFAKAIEAAVRADLAEDAERYRWLVDECRKSKEHWGGRWSIIIDGPAPESYNYAGVTAAIDAARAAKGGE